MLLMTGQSPPPPNLVKEFENLHPVKFCRIINTLILQQKMYSENVWVKTQINLTQVGGMFNATSNGIAEQYKRAEIVSIRWDSFNKI